jgi:glycosyltransferase involved in cell wall biosynthesis
VIARSEPNASNSRSRVCIITPGSIGSNPRVVKEADSLHTAGFAVHVIATRTVERVEARDQSLMRRINWQLERVDLRSRIDWWLRRLPQLAARRAYQATGWWPLAEQGFSAFTPALADLAHRTPADLYIAHYPAALPVAAAAARRFRARYAYDAEDYHLGDWPDDPAHDGSRRLVREIERRYLSGCAYVTAASPGIADAYAQTYGIARPTVLLNVFPLELAPPGPTPKGTGEPGPSVYWFSQTIGPARGLECAVKAIALARTQPHLYLRGTPAPGYADELAMLAVEAGSAERVHLLDPAAPDEMVRLASAYDLGLCGEPAHTANNARALSNKLFSYLVAGVPPLMSATPAQHAFAVEAGIEDQLYPSGDAVKLAALMDGILGSPERLRAARVRALRLATERYNWGRQSAVLVDSVARALATNPPGWINSQPTFA